MQRMMSRDWRMFFPVCLFTFFETLGSVPFELGCSFQICAQSTLSSIEISGAMLEEACLKKGIFFSCSPTYFVI
jgi:hypothetical protein